MRSTLLITIAVGCGLIAAVGVLQYMRELPKAQAVHHKQVVVAAKEIDINAPFSQENLSLVEWPSNQVPPGAIDRLEELKSKYARIRLYPGEVILPGKVMGSNDTSGSVRVPQGYRVVSVKSNAETAVSNLIEPGDRVDVIVVLGTRARTTAVAKTILRAVRVFAINREMSRNTDGSVAADAARTVSLLVMPDQAEKLMMASELGEIRLALRSPDDARVDETAGCTVRDMLGNGSVADEQTSSGLLANVAARPTFTMFDPELSGPVETSEPEWTMVVVTPSQSQTFVWGNKNDPPTEQGEARCPAPASENPPPAPVADQTPPSDGSEFLDVAHWSQTGPGPSR